jgi:hypothetical protein
MRAARRRSRASRGLCAGQQRRAAAAGVAAAHGRFLQSGFLRRPRACGSAKSAQHRRAGFHRRRRHPCRAKPVPAGHDVIDVTLKATRRTSPSCATATLVSSFSSTRSMSCCYRRRTNRRNRACSIAAVRSSPFSADRRQASPSASRSMPSGPAARLDKLENAHYGYEMYTAARAKEVEPDRQAGPTGQGVYRRRRPLSSSARNAAILDRLRTRQCRAGDHRIGHGRSQRPRRHQSALRAAGLIRRPD